MGLGVLRCSFALDLNDITDVVQNPMSCAFCPSFSFPLLKWEWRGDLSRVGVFPGHGTASARQGEGETKPWRSARLMHDVLMVSDARVARLLPISWLPTVT